MANKNIQDEIEWQSTASDVGGKIAKALTKQYLEEEVGKIAGAIGGAIAGGLATLILGEVFSLITPPDSESILDYLEDIKEIVEKAIQEGWQDNEGKIAAATISEVFTKIHNDYTLARKNFDNANTAENRQTCIDYLYGTAEGEGYIGQLTATAAIPMVQTAYPIAGLPIFIYGANLHLALLQEGVNMLNAAKEQGSHIKTDGDGYPVLSEQQIINWATTYITALDNNWNATIEARAGLILIDIVRIQYKDVQGQITDNGEIVARIAGTQYYDSVEAASNEITASANGFIQQYYFPPLLNSYSEGFSSPDAVIESWKKLLTNPMGTVQKDIDDWEKTPQLSNAYFALDGSNNATLNKGDILLSIDRNFKLEIADDGNVVIVESSLFGEEKQIWSTNIKTPIKTPTKAVMQSGGAFVLEDSTGSVIFSTNTVGNGNTLLLSSGGFLQVRNSEYNVLWNSNFGILPEQFVIETPPSICVFSVNDDFNSLGMAFKGKDDDCVYVGSSEDGVNWDYGPFQVNNANVSVDTSPAVGASAPYNAFQIVYKGNGDINLFLHSNFPRSGQGGGVVGFDGNATTSVPPSCLATPGGFTTIYKGAGDNQQVWGFTQNEVDDSDGTIFPLEGALTSDTPAATMFNSQLTVLYRGTDQAGTNTIFYWTKKTNDGGVSYYATHEQILPGAVNTSARPTVAVLNGNLYLVYLGTGDNKIWYAKMDTDYQWTGPLPLPFPLVQTDTAPVAVAFNGQVLIYFKGLGTNRLYCFALKE